MVSCSAADILLPSMVSQNRVLMKKVKTCMLGLKFAAWEKLEKPGQERREKEPKSKQCSGAGSYLSVSQSHTLVFNAPKVSGESGFHSIFNYQHHPFCRFPDICIYIYVIFVFIQKYVCVCI